MKLLSLGLDNSILNKSSALAKRVIEYGGLVEKYTVIAPNSKNEKVELSERATAYGVYGSNKLWQFIKIYGRAAKLLEALRYDIITVQDQYYLALIGCLLAKKFKLSLEIQVHGFEKYYGLRKLTAKYVLARANAIRCVSQRLKRQLVNDFGLAEKKITVVPILVEVRSKKLEIRRETNDEIFIFLTVGRLVPVKNISLQIEVMAQVIKQYPKTELWIVGDGSERRKLEVRSKKLELDKNVKFIGRQKKLEDYYGQADAFVLTSDSEGWGLAVIEAANFGLPIIMTDTGCAGEAIKDHESGLVIPVGDKLKLAAAMLKIIEDGNFRKRLGANAKLAAGRLPDKEQTLALYKKSWQVAAGI